VTLGSVVFASACGDSDEGPRAAPVEEGGNAPGEDSGESGPDGPTPAPFGLDTRPPNTTCLGGVRPTSTAQLELIDVFPSFVGQAGYVWAAQAPGDPSRWFLVNQQGQIRTIPNIPTAADSAVVLDMPPGKVRVIREGGLLGLAFDPAWATNRTAYIFYTQGPAASPDVIDLSVLSRIRSTDDGATFNLATEEVLLTVPQPFPNHKGGQIAFGPDGYLYLGLGDGGDANDPFDNGQNKNVLLGKMLRLKVAPTGPYTIPADNPFVAGGGRPEIFAYGLRNPWRWSFDRATGELWAGDVGQALYEEIDIIEKGGNYGWKLREGAHCRFPTEPPCSGDGSPIDPIWEYGHDFGFEGSGSVTGGYVYRGSKFPELTGKYFFADFSMNRIYQLDRDPLTNKASATQFAEGSYISSFAEDLAGEVYALDFYSGHLYLIAKNTSTQANAFPAKLSQTGCFDGQDPKRPLPALVPYEINAPFYSDGADKRRWLALPDGKTMTVKADGDLDFPDGTVLAKEFSLAGKRIETRLLVKHTDGDWGGYSYEWNDAQSDALLLPAGKTKAVGAVKWTYPSRGQCMACHTPAAGRSLGLEVPQMMRDVAYPTTNRLSPQIATLQHIGMLGELGAASAMPALPDPYGTAPLEARARAYLHANCSHCHRGGAPGGGALDLRAGVSFAATKACGTAPTAGTLGIAGAKLITPGDPARSVLAQRMQSTQAYRMPPLGRTTTDAQGTAVVESWIKGLTACPPP
ncbi:MAG TPA: PQQ-dependent sugar dehydrogenase, partial [Labilithrix sp.]|nr:PQQ-dependent sugar dehydrogenase [Labilithrix sp.]